MLDARQHALEFHLSLMTLANCFVCLLGNITTKLNLIDMVTDLGARVDTFQGGITDSSSCACERHMLLELSETSEKTRKFIKELERKWFVTKQ